jgi:hypothetical protein
MKDLHLNGHIKWFVETGSTYNYDSALNGKAMHQ